MLFPSPSTWKIVKDAPNHVPMNIIGLDHTSCEIPKDSDVPIFPVVLITPDPLHLTVIVPVSHYTPSAWRLINMYTTVRLVPECYIPIPGEHRNRIIPLRESGIQLPGTQIIPLMESRIYYKMEPGTSGQED